MYIQMNDMIVDERRNHMAMAVPNENGKNKGRGPKKKVVRRDFHKGRWSDEEKLLFLVGLRKFGKGRWKQIGKVLTTRSPIQIKSHGQKLVRKMEAGEDIFAELKNYESTMGSEIQAVSSSETESDDGDLLEDIPGLVQDPSLEEDALFGNWMTPSLEPLPVAASLCNLFMPPPRVLVTLRSNISAMNFQEDGSPLLQRHFGAANPISFVSILEKEPHHESNIFSKSPGSAFRPTTHSQGDDVLAAMLLCQLSSTNASREDALPHTTWPAFSSAERSEFDCLHPQQTLFSFHPIPISSSSEVEDDDEGLMSYYPLILKEQTSNIIMPTAFVEV